MFLIVSLVSLSPEMPYFFHCGTPRQNFVSEYSPKDKN